MASLTIYSTKMAVVVRNKGYKDITYFTNIDMLTQRGFIGLPILIVILVSLAVFGGGTYYIMQPQSPSPTLSENNLDNTRTLPTSDTPSSNLVPKQETTLSPTVAESTANWKVFVNSRDRYSVKYPSKEIAGTPSIDCCSDLSEFGFEKSMSFMRYGGWANIYIFSGHLNQAFSAHKKIDSENRVYLSIENIIIGGKNGKVVNWTNKLDSSSSVSHSYFVEYQPGKTLYISGSQEFVTTIKFIAPSTDESVSTVSQTSVSGTKDYADAWFRITYPANFVAKAEGTNEASFTSPDSSVQFYVYSDYSREPGNPAAYLQILPTETVESDTSTLDIISYSNPYNKKVIRLATFVAKDGSYKRSFVAKYNLYSSTASTTIVGSATIQDSIDYFSKPTRFVFGIKYKDQATYNKYLNDYLAFKKSLTRWIMN